jgi:transcriptional regulator with XRE-family HTH domain
VSRAASVRAIDTAGDIDADERRALAVRIRSLMRTGETQEAFAERLGVSLASLKVWLSGTGSEPRASSLRSIAKSAGISLDWLVLGEERRAAKAAPSVPSGIDREKLERYIRLAEEMGQFARQHGHRDTVQERVSIVMRLYDLAARGASNDEMMGPCFRSSAPSRARPRVDSALDVSQRRVKSCRSSVPRHKFSRGFR